MTQHNRETLLALADRCDAVGRRLIQKGADNHSDEQAQRGVNFLDIAADLLTRATLDPTGEKA